MSQNNPTPLEKIDICGSMLDKLVDAQGRAKCGYIYIINEFLDDIKKYILVLEEQIKDCKPENETVLAAIDLDPETISQE